MAASSLHRYATTHLVASVDASTPQHAIRIATPSTRRARIVEIHVSTRGTSSTQGPCRVRLQRAATGMTSGTGGTTSPIDPGMPATLCTSTTGMTGGLGSAGVVVADFNVPAVASVVIYPVDSAVAGICAVSSHFDLVLVGTGDTLSNVQVTLYHEE